MLTNDEFVQRLKALRVARENFEVEKREIEQISDRLPTLKEDIRRFLAAFNRCPDLASELLDATYARIKELPLPRSSNGDVRANAVQLLSPHRRHRVPRRVTPSRVETVQCAGYVVGVFGQFNASQWHPADRSKR